MCYICTLIYFNGKYILSWLAGCEILRIDWLCLNIIAVDDYLCLGEKRSGENKVPRECWMDSLDGRFNILLTAFNDWLFWLQLVYL